MLIQNSNKRLLYKLLEQNIYLIFQVGMPAGISVLFEWIKTRYLYKILLPYVY